MGEKIFQRFISKIPCSKEARSSPVGSAHKARLRQNFIN
jgi:hypothetical protein